MTVRALMFGLLLVAMVAVGCSGDDDDAATPTTASSGSDEAATTASADFDVVFDGEECTVTGPESVPAGEYTFVKTDTSELSIADVVVEAYTDGRTWADHENYIEEAGGDGSDFVRPDWAQAALRDFDFSALDLAENQTQFDHVLEAGPHGIIISARAASGGVWGCAGLEVT